MIFKKPCTHLPFKQSLNVAKELVARWLPFNSYVTLFSTTFNRGESVNPQNVDFTLHFIITVAIVVVVVVIATVFSCGYILLVFFLSLFFLHIYISSSLLKSDSLIKKKQKTQQHLQALFFIFVTYISRVM